MVPSLRSECFLGSKQNHKIKNSREQNLSINVLSLSQVFSQFLSDITGHIFAVLEADKISLCFIHWKRTKSVFLIFNWNQNVNFLKEHATVCQT